MKKLLIVTDLDASFIDDNYQYSEATETIRQLKAQGYPLVDLNLITTERWVDLLSDQSYTSQDAHLELPPYGCAWISNLS